MALLVAPLKSDCPRMLLDIKGGTFEDRCSTCGAPVRSPGTSDCGSRCGRRSKGEGCQRRITGKTSPSEARGIDVAEPEKTDMSLREIVANDLRSKDEGARDAFDKQFGSE